MGRRRQISVSEDEEEEVEAAVTKASHSSSNDGGSRRRRRNKPRQKRRRKIQFQEEDEEEVDQDREDSRSRGSEDDHEEVEEKVQEDAKPSGDAVRVTGKGRWKINHYAAFDFDGIRFELEDPVLLTPEDVKQKPYVAIIKDITQNTKDGGIMVTGQWFYRPEEAEKKGGGSWQARDTRELFYSFHRDDVPAESVMHKCVVHFVPLHKMLPNRKQFPGFIVQKVYDTEQRKLFKLTDKDYEDTKQHEIDLLVNKTMARLGDLPDLDAEDTPPLDQEEQSQQMKSKRLLRKRNLSPLDVSKEDEEATKSDQQIKSETPGTASKYFAILVSFDALTKETHRDKWLMKLLQCIEYVCSSSDSLQEKLEINEPIDSSNLSGDKPLNSESNQGKGLKAVQQLTWPDSAVSVVTALERASHETLSTDFTKYNQKLRQLFFNFKNNAFLARRLLKGELEPSKILNMSPNELKEGLTAEEIARDQPEEAERVQMTDARCKRCSDKKVALVDIIQAGTGDRYQLECTSCGCTWYASRDEASTLTIDGPSATSSMGTAPPATAKFEHMEKKKLVSPNEPEKASIFKKTTEVPTPVLETQKSLNKSKPLEDTTTTTASPKNPDCSTCWDFCLVYELYM
ncbi:hypothetical protein V2J09_014678 [Rumex salicifolius]